MEFLGIFTKTSRVFQEIQLAGGQRARPACGMNNPAADWLRLARGLLRKVNFGCWLDSAAVPVVVMAGVAAGGLLVMRHYAPASGGAWLPIMTALLPLAAMAWAWWRARKKFIGIEEALVRLEVRHHLHAALSTAWVGVGTWPATPARRDDGLSWRWGRAGFPPLLAACLLVAAWFVPVTARQQAALVSEPATWSGVETDLKTLVEERVVEESSTQETRQAIEALRARPREEWFQHSSIEAGDRIQLAHQREMAALEAKMRDAARAMREAATPGQGQEAGQAAQAEAFQQMLEGLRTGGLRPDAELMEKLSQLAGENGEGLRQLNAQELAELLEHLERNAGLLEALREQLQGMPGFPGDCENGMCQGEGEGTGQGDSDQPGQGAPTRGPGEGGPLFGDKKDGVNATQLKPLAAGDLSRAAPGDMVGEAQARHEIDEQDSPALRAGGAPVRPGDGGGAVWSDTLHPREQDALRKYFE